MPISYKTMVWKQYKVIGNFWHGWWKATYHVYFFKLYIKVQLSCVYVYINVYVSAKRTWTYTLVEICFLRNQWTNAPLLLAVMIIVEYHDKSGEIQKTFLIWWTYFKGLFWNLAIQLDLDLTQLVYRTSLFFQISK